MRPAKAASGLSNLGTIPAVAVWLGLSLPPTKCTVKKGVRDTKAEYSIFCKKT
ncbi:hypothetical protein ALC62_05428 [Cyphomyrmex costatus]|uniref:Uncharacterized protein n=1 Tax=Cyphomyrmex costatus TaxID=456900 RepID=A0A195CT86_9HYME|nr:hypothetical protein ALC62_05428 [Cyphomyrmex costatus]